jgi:hypothetical protein
MNSTRSAPRGLARVVAIGFAIGSVEHLVGLVLLGFHVEMYANYPGWRHAAFAGADAAIAFIGFSRPHRLFFPALMFLIEQIAINGTYAWRTWRVSGRILWSIPVMIVLIGAAAVIALQERRSAAAHNRAGRATVSTDAIPVGRWRSPNTHAGRNEDRASPDGAIRARRTD